MDQTKIGKFIQENRKNKNLTQEQLAEKLNVSKNAVSKWERGLNLPDVSIMQELCLILDITLNELFSGEKINEENYKAVADNNLMEALENSTFTLKEKIQFYKKKWRRENVARLICSFVLWLVIGILLKFQNVDSAVSGGVCGLIGVLFYVVFNNQMMTYVEKNAYGNTNKFDNTEKSEKN